MKIMTADILQGAILALSGLSMLLLAYRPRAGALLGLLAQPFWLVSTWLSGQWGMFLLSLVYTWSFAAMTWRHYSRRNWP